MVEASAASLETSLKRLKRGLMSNDERTTLQSYRILYKAGPTAALLVNRELERFNVEERSKREIFAAFAGLNGLLRDLDESASDSFIRETLSAKCNNSFAALLRSIKRFSRSDYRVMQVATFDIWEHVAIDKQRMASDHVRTWLADLPAQDIDGIARMYIITSDVNHDWLGTYLPGLAVITVAWQGNVSPNSCLAGLERSINRHTLLHEVGHHVHKHWFGQDPEQEEEANAYALRAAKYRKPIWVRGAALFLNTIQSVRRP